MSTHRVLLVGSKGSKGSNLDDLSLSIERDSAGDVLAEATATISDAVSRVVKNGYDAVVFWAERKDELAGVIRIRKTRPDQPILVLSESHDPDFEELAKIAGAARTAPPPPADSEGLSKYLRLAVQSGELRRELLAGARWAHTQAREVRELAQKTRDLTRELFTRPFRLRIDSFVPLLVEDDPNQAFLMIRAFERADVPSPLPILRTGEEAIAFLSQPASFENRAPTVVLLDVELPGKSGFDVLAWIRKQPRFNRLPVVMLSCSSDPEHMNRAYRLRASSYVVKPTDFDGLVELVSTLKRYWGSINLPMESL